MVPAYFAFFFLSYCFSQFQSNNSSNNGSVSVVFTFVKRLLVLCTVGLLVAAIALAPFLFNLASSKNNKNSNNSSTLLEKTTPQQNSTLQIAMGHLFQIKGRLFPFERGLTHAYWAPNFWALYNAMDKVALVALKKINRPMHDKLLMSSNSTTSASLTGGLVGLDQGTHIVLPKITPRTTIIMSLASSFLVRFFAVSAITK